jgi:hypothetical protein
MEPSPLVLMVNGRRFYGVYTVVFVSDVVMARVHRLMDLLFAFALVIGGGPLWRPSCF